MWKNYSGECGRKKARTFSKATKNNNGRKAGYADFISREFSKAKQSDQRVNLSK